MTLFMALFMAHFRTSEPVFHDTLRSTTTLSFSWQHVFHDINSRTRVWPALNARKQVTTLFMPPFMAVFMAHLWPSKRGFHDSLRSIVTLLSFSWQQAFRDINLKFSTTAFFHDMSCGFVSRHTVFHDTLFQVFHDIQLPMTSYVLCHFGGWMSLWDWLRPWGYHHVSYSRMVPH